MLQGVNRGFQGVRRGYRRLKAVTRGYWGLQQIIRGYKGFKGSQGVTGGKKASREVAKDYRNFFLTRTSSDTFSWSILHKNQS